MVGAEEAPQVFLRALRSPARGLRITAMQHASYIGEGARTLVPALWKTLEEPRLRSHALSALTDILREVPGSEPSTEEEWLAQIAKLRTQLEERGYKTR
jgi:hypothetical protein